MSPSLSYTLYLTDVHIHQRYNMYDNMFDKGTKTHRLLHNFVAPDAFFL